MPFGRRRAADEGPEFPENRKLGLYVKPLDFSMLATKSK